MDVDDPDISRCLALLDSSSSPYRLEDVGGIQYGYGRASKAIERRGGRMDLDSPGAEYAGAKGRVGGDYGYGNQGKFPLPNFL
jgi:hypothetical protein